MIEYSKSIKFAMEGIDTSSADSKRMATGYDLFSSEQQTYSEIDINEYDSIELEEDYISRLRVQRERMQKLEKAYCEKQHQLSREQDRSTQLLVQIQDLSIYRSYKEQFEELQLTHKDLINQYQLQARQLDDVTQQLKHALYENQQYVQRFKNDFRSGQNSSHIRITELEEALADKEEEAKKYRRSWKDTEQQLKQQISTLKITITKTQQELNGESTSFDNQRQKLLNELNNRQFYISDLERQIDGLQNINIGLKNDVMKLTDGIRGREQELSQMCSKLKTQLSSTKKKLCKEETKHEETLSDLKKLQAANKEMQAQIEAMKAQHHRTCDSYENDSKKMEYQYQSEINRLQMFSSELKQTIEELMRIKNVLITENRKLAAVVKRKQQIQRQRKQLLKCEFKEINKIEKVIDRLE